MCAVHVVNTGPKGYGAHCELIAHIVGMDQTWYYDLHLQGAPEKLPTVLDLKQSPSLPVSFFFVPHFG